ncbi:hypothetical protein ABDK56_06585 [Sphingomonas sp. ASV193]|uniref:hypothetical protein n=1 Tax=Sphingomonas sp. ASV193 TaxID=3144405 RepID=UPI0032E8E74D
MIPLLLFASALSVEDFGALDQAIDKCDRGAVTPTFASDQSRRSAFMTAAYAEEAAIVGARADLRARQALLRAGKPMAGDNDRALANASAALDDRQKSLDDQRTLEALRVEAIDVKRRYYLAKCASGKD